MEKPLDFIPQRVISLVPSVTESLFDLELGDRVVGITDYCTQPASGVSSLTRVGGTKNPRLDKIVQLAPDLVIVNQEENRREDVEALRKAGIAVWVTFPRSVQDALNLLWTMMDVFDEARMVYRVRSIEQTVDFISRIELTRATPCRVFAPIWLDPLMTFNHDTFAHDLLRVCGGRNVFAERERRYPLAADLALVEAGNEDRTQNASDRDVRYPRIRMGEVVAAQPDVILLPSEPFAFGEEHVALFERLDVPAARDQRIHLVDGSLLTWHGTRIAHALTIIPALLCPTDNM
jgi:ABC-type Fe3+-hydroxamate transport system substrate-binding protein